MQTFRRHSIELPLVARRDFIVETVRGLRVVDVGCLNAPATRRVLRLGKLLFSRLAESASEIIGLDVDVSLRDVIPEHLRDRVVQADVMDSGQLVAAVPFTPDVVVMAEVLEHMVNPGLALGNVREAFPTTFLVVSVPNALHARNMRLARRGVEAVHTDHVAWYSPVTLRTLLGRTGWADAKFYAYSPTGQPRRAFGRGMMAAPGIVAVARTSK